MRGDPRPPGTQVSPLWPFHTRHQLELEKLSLKGKRQVLDLRVKSNYFWDKLNLFLPNQAVEILALQRAAFESGPSPSPSLPGFNFITPCPRASHLFSILQPLSFAPSSMLSASSIHPSIYTLNRIYQPPAPYQAPC